MKNLLAALVLILASPAVSADALNGETRLVLKSLGMRYADLKFWKAKFSQETINLALGTNSFNEGEFVFAAPNKFRFSIIRTDRSDFISNGKEAWHILFDGGNTKPAYVKQFSNIKNLELDRYLFLLRGISFKTKKEQAQLLEKFKVEGKNENDVLRLKLLPKKASEITEILIEAKNSEKVPHLMTLVDALGVTTKIRISSWEKLKSVGPQEFVPSIPKDTKVETYN